MQEGKKNSKQRLHCYTDATNLDKKKNKETGIRRRPAGCKAANKLSNLIIQTSAEGFSWFSL